MSVNLNAFIENASKWKQCTKFIKITAHNASCHPFWTDSERVFKKSSKIPDCVGAVLSSVVFELQSHACLRLWGHTSLPFPGFIITNNHFHLHADTQWGTEPEQMHTSLSRSLWERVCQQTLSPDPHFKIAVDMVMKNKKWAGEIWRNLVFIALLLSFSVTVLCYSPDPHLPPCASYLSVIPHSPDCDWQPLREALQAEWRRSRYKRKSPQNK